MTEQIVQQMARKLLEAALEQGERLAEELQCPLVDALAIQMIAVEEVSERLRARVMRLRKEEIEQRQEVECRGR